MGLLGYHIRSLRKNAGVSIEELSEASGVGITTIKNIETGYVVSPDISILEKFAQIFSVSVEELLNSYSPMIEERSKMVHVAEYISCEKPFLEPELIVDTVFLDRDEARGYEYVGIRMQDDSMIDSHICCGDSVIIRLGETIKNGDKAVCVFNGTDSIIRKVYTDGNNVVLKANNHNGLYPDIRLDKEKDNFRILGKVVKWMHSVKEND